MLKNRLVFGCVALVASLAVACGPGDDNAKTQNNNTNNGTQNNNNGTQNNNNGTQNTVDCSMVANACDTESASCAGNTLTECAPDANGCLVETTTDCAANSQFCDASGAEPTCADPTGPACEPSVQTISCSDEGMTINGDTANGSQVLSEHGCALFGDDFPGKEVVYTFQSAETVDVTVTASFDSTLGDFDLYALEGTDVCTSADLACAGLGASTESPEVLEFGAIGGETTFVVFDLFGDDDGSTAPFTLDIACDTPVCGDGVIGAGEECDDTNTTSGDGCSDTCTIETDYVCSEEPSVCTPDVCGDGIVSVNEQCDDNNTTDGDGCSATCETEFGFSCDDADPSTCSALTKIGTFGAGDTIPDTNGGALAAGERTGYLIEFTETVILEGTASVATTGDVDLAFTFEDGEGVFSAGTTGDEDWSGIILGAGEYQIDIGSFGTEDVDGFTLTMSTTGPVDQGAYDAGDTITNITGGPLARGESDIYQITFNADVMLGGSLTSTGGDADLYIYSGGGDFLTLVADDGDEPDLPVALKAGTYLFQVNAWNGADTDITDYTLAVTTSALSLTDLGSFGAGDAISDTTGGPLTAREYDHFTITFTEDVLLSGTLGGNTTGELALLIYDADTLAVDAFATGDDVFEDVEVAAGDYIVQIVTFSAEAQGGDVDAYTLSMSSTAP